MYKTGAKYWVIGLAIIVALVITGSIVSFFLGWFQTGVDIISPDNVREQWQFAYEFEESLSAIAQQICNAQSAYDMATSDNERSQRLTHLLGYQNNYVSVAATYNARMRNNFEAGLVKPNDVQELAPTLDSLMQLYCPSSSN
jgi:hypothetical protein